MLARRAQERLLLALGQRAGRSADRLDVRSHAGMTASIRGEGKSLAQRVAFFADLADTP
jgi:hypothetical protein